MAIALRGSVEPADYKRDVLPIIFPRFLSLRYDRQRVELEALVGDKNGDDFGDKKAPRLGFTFAARPSLPTGPASWHLRAASQRPSP